MNLFLGILFLFISVSLICLLLFILKKKEGAAYQMLSSEINTENGEPLIRVLPLNHGDMEKLVCADMRIHSGFYGRFKSICNGLLAKMLIFEDSSPIVRNIAYQIMLMEKLMDRAKGLTATAGNSKEIVISKLIDKQEKVSDNIKLHENLIPAELYEILWSALVIGKAQELFEDITRYIDRQNLETLTSEWLTDSDSEKIKEALGKIRELLRSIRNNIFMGEAGQYVSMLDDISAETLQIFKNITAEIVKVKKTIVISNKDKEKDTVDVVNKYEAALTAYLSAAGLRTLAAATGAFLPASYNISRQNLEDCRRMLEDVRGQITVLLRAMDSVDADEFFSISKDGGIEKEQTFFSLAYPSYLLYELLNWYKKHLVTESIGLIQAKLQPKFWSHETLINELLKIVDDTSLRTDKPIKGELSLLALTDKSGAVTDMKWIVRLKQSDIE